MNDLLQRILGEAVYEKMRESLLLTSPQMKTWEALSEEEKRQFMEGINLWIRGLGANEVGDTWYRRSGQVPRAFWQQIAGEHKTLFKFAAYDLICCLVELAEKYVTGAGHDQGTNTK